MNLLPKTERGWIIVTTIFSFFQVPGNLYFLQFDEGPGYYTRSIAIAANVVVFLMGINYLREKQGQQYIVLTWRLIILFQTFVCYGVTDPQSKMSMAFILLGGIMFIEEFAEDKSWITTLSAVLLFLSFVLPTTYVLHDVEPYSKINFYFILPLFFVLFSTQRNRRLGIIELLNTERKSKKWFMNLLGLLVHNIRTPLTKVNLELELSKYRDDGMIEASKIENTTGELFNLSNLMLVAQQGAQEDNLCIQTILDKLLLPPNCTRTLDESQLTYTLTVEEFLALYLALDNLLSNASKFKVKKMGLTLNSVNGRPKFQVSDDGPGIPQAIFSERARSQTQVHRSTRQGMGVGLALSYDAIQLIGWKMYIEKSGKRGSAVSVIAQ